MDFIKFFKKLAKTEPSEMCYRYSVDQYGINFLLDPDLIRSVDSGDIDSSRLKWQQTLLKSLAEAGLAEKISNGYEVETEAAVELDDEFAALFEFPSHFEGELITKIKGQTTQAAFNVSSSLRLTTGEEISHFELDGPFLKLSDTEIYRLKKADWQAIDAIHRHQHLSAEEKTEYQNNWLIFELQLAEKAGCKIDLGHFNNIEFIKPDKVGVSIQELDSGDLVLTPAYGEGISTNDIDKRLGHLKGEGDNRIFRVKNSFVLLDDDRMAATHEIISSRTIPKAQVRKFMECPTAFLDGVLIDLDTGFSLRVKGAEKFTHAYFGDIEKSGATWFGNDELVDPQKDIAVPPEALSSILTDVEKVERFEEEFNDAVATGATCLNFDDQNINIDDTEAVRKEIKSSKERVTKVAEENNEEEKGNEEFRAVVAIDANDECADFSLSDSVIDQIDFSKITFERNNLKRKPFPHQLEGIQWLLGLLNTSLSTNDRTVPGGLLADDMGLGKTYMTLVGIADYLNARKRLNLTEKPVMIVAPLGLIENWVDEIDKTFDKSPFRDIVVLQSSAGLKTYKLKGAKTETKQTFKEDSIGDINAIRYSLKVGKEFGGERLDMPNRLVLTTYDAVRDYQFSLGRIDWSVVAFDEAQNIKNPNTLVTRASKGLKADFKLLATGTPVENSLKDFWCLFDTAVPGLLGAWQDFRELYISPILKADAETALERKIEVGKSLREKVGKHMLRRIKEDQLEGLPPKKIWTGDANLTNERIGFSDSLSDYMKGVQKQRYDEVIHRVRSAGKEEKQKVVLASLHALREISIHPEVDDKKILNFSNKDVKASLELSAKMKSLVMTLGEIKKRDEKVIIFAMSKKLQTYMSVTLGLMYKLDVPIINGDTKAVKSKKGEPTRKGIIEEFEKREGFGVIIMSPIAAGVGLTVVGANNVIHLERHWNPAKEAQATDRVYRIGQKKDVNVYIPMSLHTDMPSFDVSLNILLSKKTDLSQAVVAQEEVQASDLLGMFR